MTADVEPPRRHAKHWRWFAATLATLGVLGFGASSFLMLPLGMATDGCFESSTDPLCTMSAAGQNTVDAPITAYRPTSRDRRVFGDDPHRLDHRAAGVSKAAPNASHDKDGGHGARHVHPDGRPVELHVRRCGARHANPAANGAYAVD